MRAHVFFTLLVLACAVSGAKRPGEPAPAVRWEPSSQGGRAAVAPARPSCREGAAPRASVAVRPLPPVSAARPLVDGAAGRDAFAALQAWYAGRDERPDVAALVAGLTGPEAQQAAARVAAILVQAEADERFGWSLRRPSRPGEADGSIASAGLRRALARELGAKAAGEAALPVVRALLADPLPDVADAGLAILRRTRGAAADREISEVLRAPELRSFALLIGAIELASERRLDVEGLQRLTTHPHPGVRASARAALARSGGTSTAYDPVSALRSWLAADLERAAARVWPALPRDARWTRLSRKVSDERDEGPHSAAYQGWLLGQDRTHYRILTWYGVEVSVARARVRRVDARLVDAVDELLRLRALPKEARAEALSFHGRASAQFESQVLSAPELLVAAWSHAAGDDAGAARLIGPRVAELAGFGELETTSRTLLGHVLHQRMVESFQAWRDDEALALADRLGRPDFVGFDYHDQARELAAQLRARADEPAPVTGREWEVVRAGLSRSEQALFWTVRLRHLTIRPWGAPGGVAYMQGRASAPEAASAVHPYAALQFMRLQPAELLPLVPWLADATYMRAAGYLRPYVPERELHRASWALAVVINDALGTALVDARALARLDPTDRAAELGRITAEIVRRCGS